jgi:curli biogenesis system outer membrane secretion channel CsgG
LENSVKRFYHILSVGLVAGGLSAGVVGCAKTGESAGRDTLTQNVGNYPSPPSNAPTPRLGVPTFTVEGQPAGFGGNKEELGRIAADQLTTLAHKTRRFEVIERAQLQQLLREQNMEGIVRPDQMAKAGQVLGSQYLLYGSVTSFRIKSESTSTGVNAGGLGSLLGGRFGGGDTGYNQRNVTIKTEVGVDIRLVDPTTGGLLTSEFGEFNRLDTAEALGISVMGFGTQNDAQVQVSQEDAGKLLRLALDDAMRKMIPEIDAKLAAKARAAAPATPVPPAAVNPPPAPAPVAPAAPAMPAPTPVAADPSPAAKTETPAPAAKPRFCSHCGKPVPAGAKFCENDGTKIE